MALRDLIRKRGSEAAASARPAIPASEGERQHPKIAKIAGIALANSAKPNPAANDPVKPTVEVLEQFQFDLTDEDIAADIAAGYPATDIVRVNNMAWEFMQHDRMTFSDAIREAARRVTSYSIMECESAYEDVQALWKRIRGAA